MSKITKNMTFDEIIKKFPKAVEILAKYDMHCIGCHISSSETLGEGAMVHGFSDEKLNQMLNELNEAAV